MPYAEASPATHVQNGSLDRVVIVTQHFPDINCSFALMKDSLQVGTTSMPFFFRGAQLMVAVTRINFLY